MRVLDFNSHLITFGKSFLSPYLWNERTFLTFWLRSSIKWGQLNRMNFKLLSNSNRPWFYTAYKSLLLSQLLHIECLLYAKHLVSNFCTWSSSFVGSQSKVSALMLKELLIKYTKCLNCLGLPICRWQVLNVQLLEEKLILKISLGAFYVVVWVLSV